MNRVFVGDALLTLRSLPAASFDACLSDPPYGLDFLGLAWDKVLPPTAVWVQLARVLKPGAVALVFGGTRTFHRLLCSLEDAGFEVADVLCWLHSQGMPKSRALLKPAWEPIAMVRAPGAKRVTPLNIDGCRIGAGDGGEREGESSRERRYVESGTSGFAMKPGPRGGAAEGRWPANVIVDEDVAWRVDEASGVRKSAAMKAGTVRGTVDSLSGGWADGQVMAGNEASAGGASRFFYCPKSKGEERVHPTQKPVALTEWLAKLLLVPDGHLLVPYSGVGSEMVGAARAGWTNVTGIERSREYVEIAKTRLDYPACRVPGTPQ